MIERDMELRRPEDINTNKERAARNREDDARYEIVAKNSKEKERDKNHRDGDPGTEAKDAHKNPETQRPHENMIRRP